MSLLEWLKIWCKFYRIPLFCNTEYPPPPPENWNLARSWDFEYFQLQNTPPPENWNLARSWDFEYFQLQNTPPKLKFSQILGLWVFSITEYPPPPRKLKFRQILGLWVFSITEYHPPPRSSQWETMCSKLPHVETLSNMDNYSFVLLSRTDCRASLQVKH